MALLDLDDLPGSVLEGTLETRTLAVPEYKSEAAIVREELARLEDKILQKASTAVLDGLMYTELPFDAQGPPQEWVDELGEKRAWDRFRAARANQMNNKEAPVGAKHAVLVHAGITKARASEKGRPVSLNVGKVYLTMPAPQFPEKELENDE